MATQLLSDFPELSHLSRQDLEDLLVDPTYFQAILHSLEPVKRLYQSQAELGLANESISRNNLALQQSLYTQRSEAQEAFEAAKSLEQQWKDIEKEQKDVYQRFSPQFLHMRLRHSAIAQDDASEALASTFVQHSFGGAARDGTEVDDFVREFKELRKVYHKRAMWNERWTKGDVIWRKD